jgi:MFS family permease
MVSCAYRYYETGFKVDGIFFLARALGPAECQRVSPAPHPERLKLAALFFLTAFALGLWNVNFSAVLKAYGYEVLVPYAWATNALAAMIAPLVVGALADQRFSSEKVLRGLALGAATFITLQYYAIQQQWHWGVVLGLTQVHALWSVPSFGLATSLVIGRLHNPRTQFGPLRAWATTGWIAAGLLISWVLQADTSVVSGFSAAVAWLVVVAVTFTLKPVPPPGHKQHRTWSDVLGLEAWSLLKHPDHRVVFLGAGLLNAPLAAFYQSTPLHLGELGVKHATAYMALGQVMEIVGLVMLAWLLGRFRLKWLFLGGIAFGMLRYLLFSRDTVAFMGLGIFMHGILFTLFYMTAQIYLEHRIPAAMRARAQALLSLMMSGFGNLIGSLGCGWWWHACYDGQRTDWHTYWLGLAGVVGVIFLWFAWSYRGRHRVDGGEH